MSQLQPKVRGDRLTRLVIHPEVTRAVVRGPRAVFVLALPAGFEQLPLEEQRRVLEREATKALGFAFEQIDQRALDVSEDWTPSHPDA
jgi:hypothetical protein